MSFYIFKTCQFSRIRFQPQFFVESGALASNYAGSYVESERVASNYAGSYVESERVASRGGVWGRSPQEEVTAAAATAAVSQELSPFDLALGASRPGSKYPVRGIPHFDKNMCFLDFSKNQ